MTEYFLETESSLLLVTRTSTDVRRSFPSATSVRLRPRPTPLGVAHGRGVSGAARGVAEGWDLMGKYILVLFSTICTEELT